MIGKKSKDSLNITVPMKTSFFEFVKANFISDLEDYVNIVRIDNAGGGAKAATESNGDAYVEYSMDITFRAQKYIHCVKLTAYSTTSQLDFQPIGEKSGPKDYLGQEGSLRFFVENFLLPWSIKVIARKRFNEVLAST